MPRSYARALIVTTFVLGCVEGETETSSESASGSASASSGATATGSGSASGSGPDTASGQASGSGPDTGSGTDTGSGCGDELPNPEYICCDGVWVDPRSDLLHCGGCDTVCSGATPFCDQGTCGVAPCEGEPCPDGASCCGTMCCDAGTICCTVNGPVESGPACVEPTDTGSCPPGCAPLCQCAAPDTAIATPTGERAIAELAPGDLVYSVDDGQITVVPIARVQRVPVSDHRVTRVLLDDGRTLRVTPSHPFADGRTFADLGVGQRLGDASIVEVETIRYDEPFTHDILPLSSSAAYFVAGELVASTMR